MEVTFAHVDLEELYYTAGFTMGLSDTLVRAYRKMMGSISAAADERDLRNTPGYHFERLKGARSHQHSLRLNRQFRLIIELKGKGTGKQVHIIGIEDYH
jgi:toxin HigB-1